MSTSASRTLLSSGMCLSARLRNSSSELESIRATDPSSSGCRTSVSLMKFSVTVGAVGDGRDPRGLAELARAVEDSGWDGLFLEDYLVYQGDASQPTYDPWICLAAIATATVGIRIGTTVTPLPRRRPWKVAAEVVALDHL